MNLSSTADQVSIDKKNAAYWDELCGSQLAKQIGVTDNSPTSLKKFDDWYFRFYPYLDQHIPFGQMKGRDVLEIGLGYGTVSQKIAESGARYSGLDIAAGPVAMVKHRCDQIGARDAKAVQGSVLEAPFEAGSFDWVVAIGCLHHTGNLARAISEVHRVLRLGGQAMIMVYSAASYRQYATNPMATWRRYMSSTPYRAPTAAEWERGAYDRRLDGTAAPQTEFVTKLELASLCSGFAKVKIKSENIGAEGYLRYIPRPVSCRVLGPIVGLDLYASLQK